MTGYRPEVAASFSAGGFSNARCTTNRLCPPSSKAIPRPLQVRSPSRDVTLSDLDSGRGPPDIAAQAVGFPFFLDCGENVGVGTSGSTPVRLSYLDRQSSDAKLTAHVQIVAGIISLCNDYGLMAPLGFLNP